MCAMETYLKVVMGNNNQLAGAQAANNGRVQYVEWVIAGRFRLVECEDHFLGEGGFGQVWRGQAIAAPEHDVAVKKIPIGKTDERELELLEKMKQIQHRNILKVFEISIRQQNQYVFIVTEICDMDLSKYTGRCGGKLRIPALRDLAKQIGEGYVALFNERIIHRDLKPDNILVKLNNGFPTYKIADFGCGDIMHMSVQYMSAQAGTPAFSAPELLVQGHYDHRADIWSIGVMLYLCATGDYPIPDEIVRKMVIHCMLGMKKMDAFDVSFPGSMDSNLRDLLYRMLRFDYHDRVTAEQFLRHPFVGSTELIRTERNGGEPEQAEEEDDSQVARLLAALLEGLGGGGLEGIFQSIARQQVIEQMDPATRRRIKLQAMRLHLHQETKTGAYDNRVLILQDDFLNKLVRKERSELEFQAVFYKARKFDWSAAYDNAVAIQMEDFFKALGKLLDISANPLEALLGLLKDLPRN